MITIFFNEKIIYKTNSDYYILSSAKLTRELNQGDTFEFSAPPGSALSNMFKNNGELNEFLPNVFQKYIMIYDSDAGWLKPKDSCWAGYLVDLEIDIDLNIHGVAYGGLSILENAITDLTYFEYHDIYNSEISLEDFFKFIISFSSVERVRLEDLDNDYWKSLEVNRFKIDSNQDVKISESLKDVKIPADFWKNENQIASVKDLIKKYFLDEYGGFISFNQYVSRDPLKSGFYGYLENDHFNIFSSEDLEKNDSQILMYGDNILSLNLKIQTSSSYNGILPIGKNNLYLHKSELAQFGTYGYGPCVLSSEKFTNRYLYNYKTVYFDQIDSISKLKEEGTKSLDLINQEYDMEIELRAFDKYYLDKERYTEIRVPQLIRVISKPHNIDNYFICKKIEKDLLQPENSIYTIGASTPKISENKADYSKKYDYSINFAKRNISEINKKLNEGV